MKITITFFVLTAILSTGCARFSSTDNSKKDSNVSYNATLDTYPYPYEVKFIELTTQEQKLKMAYMFLEKKGSNKTAVLLHGKNFSGFYWQKTAELLLEKGFSVLIPDQIGFGKSDKPSSYQFSFSQLALNTNELIKKLNLKNITLVGHSMGGMLATKYNKLYPEDIKKLVLINPIGLEDYLRYVQYKDVQFFYKSELNKNAAGIRKYQMANYYDGKWSDEYEELIKFQVGQINGNEWAKVAWNNALTYDLIFSEPVVDDFKYIKNSTVLIIGTRDRTGPGKGFMKEGVRYKLGQYQNLGKETAKKFKNAQLYELEGLGHMPQIEDFARFEKVFLKAL